MQIDKIEISNFKIFNEGTVFNFNKDFNLIIGINGSGKTSLLRALAISLAGWANAYIKDDNNLRPIEDNEVREIQQDRRFDKTQETFIKAYGKTTVIDRYENKKSGSSHWTRKRNDEHPETYVFGDIQYGNYPKSYNLNFDSLSSDILKYIDKGNTFNLPIIAFYECDRLWEVEDTLDIEETAKVQYSRFSPYKDCFHTGANHKAIGEWLLKYELVKLQKKEETPVLDAIKNAARNALEKCTDISFDFEEGRVIVDFEDDISIPFEHLSDGQRTLVGLFCDIARRAAILNPHFEGEANEKTNGVILIDELDLHLHPKWQMNIIKNLQNTFPNIQFICTTHSPVLLQSIEKEKIIILENGQQSTLEFFTKGRDINSVLYDLMGVPKRPEEYENKVDNLFGYLEDENIEKSQVLLDELKNDYGQNDNIVQEAQILLDMLNEE
jgi:predicted ATP-binding protein involved in virulence